jgi:hypothetical protein
LCLVEAAAPKKPAGKPGKVETIVEEVKTETFVPGKGGKPGKTIVATELTQEQVVIPGVNIRSYILQ